MSSVFCVTAARGPAFGCGVGTPTVNISTAAGLDRGVCSARGGCSEISVSFSLVVLVVLASDEKFKVPPMFSNQQITPSPVI